MHRWFDFFGGRRRHGMLSRRVRLRYTFKCMIFWTSHLEAKFTIDPHRTRSHAPQGPHPLHALPPPSIPTPPTMLSIKFSIAFAVVLAMLSQQAAAACTEDPTSPDYLGCDACDKNTDTCKTCHVGYFHPNGVGCTSCESVSPGSTTASQTSEGSAASSCTDCKERSLGIPGPPFFLHLATP
jgi:hypothetical protein